MSSSKSSSKSPNISKPPAASSCTIRTMGRLDLALVAHLGGCLVSRWSPGAAGRNGQRGGHGNLVMLKADPQREHQKEHIRIKCAQRSQRFIKYRKVSGLEWFRRAFLGSVCVCVCACVCVCVSPCVTCFLKHPNSREVVSVKVSESGSPLGAFHVVST